MRTHQTGMLKQGSLSSNTQRLDSRKMNVYNVDSTYLGTFWEGVFVGQVDSAESGSRVWLPATKTSAPAIPGS